MLRQFVMMTNTLLLSTDTNGELTNYFQETLAVDPRGNVVLEGRGDGNRVRRYFEKETGQAL
ncbi:hypothetical protein [Umboniibacter marinipuniceus]|uniref:hypothetical protein n=1 Tax=Umboniibacter marinipuniceus TaxID=569599 RepID=UPI0011C377ED|nr:hypothetical protein [Umboniibacter marinipuniceus]